MSQDIRSFFKILPKKGANTPPSKPKPVVIHSSDEDIVESTPDTKKNKVPTKKRKLHVLSSDSEDETNKKQEKQKQQNGNKETQKKLKPVSSLENAFGSGPIKQSKVEKVATTEKNVEEKQKPEKKSKSKKQKTKNTELGIHKDEAFEKTLLDLDDDLIMENLDALDRTIEEATKHDEEKKNNKHEKENIDKHLEENKMNHEEHDLNKTIEVGCTPKKDKTPRKRKISEENSEIDPDQERYEKKRHSAMLYQKYLNRGGPKHHGAKELPKGKPNCLKNLCFLRTGVLDSLDSDEFENLIKEHGGRVVHAVSKKVSYVVVGDEPGPAKLEKAKNYGIPTISEDELLDMIRTKSGMKAIYTVKTENDEKPNGGDQTEDSKQKESSSGDSVKSKRSPEKNKKEAKVEIPHATKRSPVKSKNERKAEDEIPCTTKKSKNETKTKETEIPQITNKKSPTKIKNETLHTSTKANNAIQNKPHTVTSKPPKTEKESEKSQIDTSHSSIWTEKYKPQKTSAIIGQHGDKSNMAKLKTWLQNWHRNHVGHDKPKLVRPSPWAKSDDGAYFKCALISGPPGVGKTTTATLVAKELEFDVVEFNASDTRSKKLLHEEVAQLLSTKSLAGFATGGQQTTSKRVLLMDEVDGMAGNEDRGGIQELINLIKKSSIPVICLCNDRNHPKIRSLSNYCFDLRFSKPKLEQIKGAMRSICFKENINISGDALNEIILGAGMDIRQTLNNLFIWSCSNKSLDVESVKKDANAATKDVVLGPWEVVRQVFSAEAHKGMKIADRARLFFYDYSIGPLFVQENYLQVVPHAPKKDFLKCVSNAADAISMGDTIDAKIRGSNNWSLLETQAMFSSVLPGFYMEGHMGGQINFPAWLGKNSKRGKFQRLLSELQTHARMSISGGRSAMNLDYLPYLRDKVVMPLVKEGNSGIPEAVSVMNSYHFIREDLDGLVELSHWPEQKDVMSRIETKVKTAFTRTFNKEAPVLPYSTHSATSKKRTTVVEEDPYGGNEAAMDSEPENDDDISKDAMIKEKKQPAKKTKKTEDVKKPSTSGRKGKKK